MYTLSMGIKSSHPAKSTAASTAGGCWPTETKQTRRAVQLQSLPLIWRGKGSCETLSYLRHQMKGVIQQRYQSSPCRQRSSTFFPRSLHVPPVPAYELPSESLEGTALLQPGSDKTFPEISGSLSTDISGFWMGPLGCCGRTAPVLR